MTDMCTYPGDRDETLVAYLYDDIDAAARSAFDAHLVSCTACRDELASLQGVRQRLARWSPPEPNFVVASPPSTTLRVTPSESRGHQSWLPEIPAWAQVAAAMLILGVAAGIANLNVHYDQNGLTVRTGWSSPASPAPAAPSRSGEETMRADTVSHAELIALEQRLKDDVRALQSSAHAVAASDTQPARAAADAEVMRRVRALLDEGEKRQQRELALRVGEVLRDVNAQRQADLVKIDRSLGLVQNNLGVEVLKQRERVNYLMRVNQRP